MTPVSGWIALRAIRATRIEPCAAEFIGMRQATTQEMHAVRRLENQSFLLLLVAVTLAFGWILAPFYGAILWAIVVAVIFAPLNRRLQRRMGGRPNPPPRRPRC